MKLDKNLNILIVGLGLIGGSYAMGLKKRGYSVCAIDTNAASIDYALKNKIIDVGSTAPDEDLIGKADLCIFALYPHIFTNWINENQHKFKSGAVISDVTGVKSCIVYEIQNKLRSDVEFISAHPMAGKEVYGIENSDDQIFKAANYIIVPTDKNTFNAIEICKGIGETLEFARISSLPPKAHDEMIGFVSQLTHVIAMCLMTCSKSEHLVDYTGDSFRDLTRIARINENMWSELFLLNKNALLEQMKKFSEEFEVLYKLLEADDTEGIKEKMRRSTERRALFDK
ncbi:MAG: prephenate dehydrogenase [Oscillospiraceae bacterium]|nr:prephenate dehydrogenase [Oscillospiraceae bacterium]